MFGLIKLMFIPHCVDLAINASSERTTPLICGCHASVTISTRIVMGIGSESSGLDKRLHILDQPKLHRADPSGAGCYFNFAAAVSCKLRIAWRSDDTILTKRKRICCRLCFLLKHILKALV
jgi:hypothetical protein